VRKDSNLQCDLVATCPGGPRSFED
jgi:hypothetical protein